MHPLSYRILVPQPGMEPVAPSVAAWGPNHWATGAVL